MQIKLDDGTQIRPGMRKNIVHNFLQWIPKESGGTSREKIRWLERRELWRRWAGFLNGLQLIEKSRLDSHLGKRENLMTGVFVALYCIKSIKDTASRVEACAEYFISTLRCSKPHPIRRYNPIQSVHPSTYCTMVLHLPLKCFLWGLLHGIKIQKSRSDWREKLMAGASMAFHWISTGW